MTASSFSRLEADQIIYPSACYTGSDVCTGWPLEQDLILSHIVAPCHAYIHALICGIPLAGRCRLALYDENFSPLGKLLVARDRNTVNTNILLMHFSSYSCVPLPSFPGQWKLVSCSHILPFDFRVFSLGRRPVCHDFSTSTQTVWVQLQSYALQASEELSFRQASLGAVPIVTLTNGTDKEFMRAEWNPVSICYNKLTILLQNRFKCFVSPIRISVLGWYTWGLKTWKTAVNYLYCLQLKVSRSIVHVFHHMEEMGFFWLYSGTDLLNKGHMLCFHAQAWDNWPVE